MFLVEMGVYRLFGFFTAGWGIDIFVSIKESFRISYSIHCSCSSKPNAKCRDRCARRCDSGTLERFGPPRFALHNHKYAFGVDNADEIR